MVAARVASRSIAWLRCEGKRCAWRATTERDRRPQSSLIVRRSTPAMASRDALIRKLARMAAREDDSTAHDQSFQEAARPVVHRLTSPRKDVTRPAGESGE
jgi:hypothetical protein